MVKPLRKIVHLAIYLVAWILGLLFVCFLLGRRNLVGPAFGRYDASLHCRTSHLRSDRGGAEWEVDIQGQTRSQWGWDDSGSYRYQTLSIGWTNYVPRLTGGELTIDPGTMKYTAGGSSGTLTPQLLGEWLAGRTGDREGVAELFGFIKKAGEGTLPPPRHSPAYQLDEPLVGNLTHLSAGFGLPIWPAILWTPLYVVLVVLVRQVPKIVAHLTRWWRE